MNEKDNIYIPQPDQTWSYICQGGEKLLLHLREARKKLREWCPDYQDFPGTEEYEAALAIDTAIGKINKNLKKALHTVSFLSIF